MRTLVAAVGIAMAVVAAAARRADACSCVENPEPCEAFWQADVVFVGKVESVKRFRKQGKLLVLESSATVTVLETFRGTLARRVEVGGGGSGGGSCDVGFERGKRYLIYATRDGDRIGTSLCSRTVALGEEAAADLAYARERTPRERAVIFGTVRRVTQNDADRLHVAGLDVRATGTSHRTHTDVDGNYQLHVPVGNYALEIAGEMIRADDGRDIVLPDTTACAKRDLAILATGSIEGQITIAGNPAPGVEVEARTPRLIEPRTARTAQDGRYTIANLPSDDYLVAVRGRTIATPYPSVGFPRPVGVGMGTVARAIDIDLPATPLAVHVATVRVRYADGRPARKPVSILTPSTTFQVESDANGRFALRVVDGVAIKLTVCARRCDTKEIVVDEPMSIELTAR